MGTVKRSSLKNNFGIYKPEILTLEKQIYLFKNASVILGAHGAAFTNIIFCKPKTKIIELIPSDHPNRKCERICKVLNLKYYRIKTKNIYESFVCHICFDTCIMTRADVVGSSLVLWWGPPLDAGGANGARKQ